MQHIEHRVLLVFRIAGGRVDAHLSARAERFGVVLNDLDLAVRHIVARGIESGGRIGERLLVVRAQLDAAAFGFLLGLGARLLGRTGSIVSKNDIYGANTPRTR